MRTLVLLFVASWMGLLGGCAKDAIAIKPSRSSGGDEAFVSPRLTVSKMQRSSSAREALRRTAQGAAPPPHRRGPVVRSLVASSAHG